MEPKHKSGSLTSPEEWIDKGEIDVVGVGSRFEKEESNKALIPLKRTNLPGVTDSYWTKLFRVGWPSQHTTFYGRYNDVVFKLMTS